ncbi:hypothetical protein ONS95_014179 [Cadophora gregata]|uniref:uncharacterized protein n=1 Tax=Cadophora gregata TaxID=51156 RepID=UPI0026DB9BD7|nr:uncharacterized protein ONS95_014179 [Cadophora gregata]KAK0114694.1 hypothetical protein ONS95_014179 [Cadophora gregata]
MNTTHLDIWFMLSISKQFVITSPQSNPFQQCNPLNPTYLTHPQTGNQNQIEANKRKRITEANKSVPSSAQPNRTSNKPHRSLPSCMVVQSHVSVPNPAAAGHARLFFNLS